MMVKQVDEKCDILLQAKEVSATAIMCISNIIIYIS